MPEAGIEPEPPDRDGAASTWLCEIARDVVPQCTQLRPLSHPVGPSDVAGGRLFQRFRARRGSPQTFLRRESSFSIGTARVYDRDHHPRGTRGWESSGISFTMDAMDFSGNWACSRIFRKRSPGWQRHGTSSRKHHGQSFVSPISGCI